MNILHMPQELIALFILLDLCTLAFLYLNIDPALAQVKCDSDAF